MKSLFMILVLVVGVASAQTDAEKKEIEEGTQLAADLMSAQDSEQKFIPVSVWPRVIYFGGKQIVNASIKTCVKAGYRLLSAKPATPEGKRIKSEEIVQDDKDPTKCKYDIVYEDIPEPVIPDPPVPEVLTNIASDRVAFLFTTNGQERGVVWLDAPVTNIAVGE